MQRQRREEKRRETTSLTREKRDEKDCSLASSGSDE